MGSRGLLRLFVSHRAGRLLVATTQCIRDALPVVGPYLAASLGPLAAPLGDIVRNVAPAFAQIRPSLTSARRREYQSRCGSDGSSHRKEEER